MGRSKVYLVTVEQRVQITYRVAATSRKEAAEDVKKLKRNERDRSFDHVGDIKVREKVTGVVDEALIPKRKIRDD